MRYIKYVQSLGFSGVASKATKAPKDELRGFTFTGFDVNKTRQTLGKSKAHKPNLFVFVFSKTRSIRVDTSRNVILLGNSSRALRAFMESVK